MRAPEVLDYNDVVIDKKILPCFLFCLNRNWGPLPSEPADILEALRL